MRKAAVRHVFLSLAFESGKNCAGDRGGPKSYKSVLHYVIQVSAVSIITIRVPKKVKEKLKKHNINVSETVRKILDERLEELERQDLEERLEQVKERLGTRIDPEMIARLSREDRETH
jgi:post-segregation antitoxin (ccd killing protein)